MKNTKALFDYESLVFFGRVNASISHELKNIMAIISETAGLLSDLSEMASKESPVNPGMLKDSAETIMEVIQRGFTTIRQMNRFSHSVDAPFVCIDLIALLDLVCQLSNYLSFAGKIRLAPWEGKPPMVQTCPFVLQSIIYEIVVQHFKYAGPNAELNITVQSRSHSGWDIIFSSFNTDEFQVLPDDHVEKAAASIAVVIDWDRVNKQLELHVPIDLHPGAMDGGSAELTDGSGTPPIRMEST